MPASEAQVSARSQPSPALKAPNTRAHRTRTQSRSAQSILALLVALLALALAITFAAPAPRQGSLMHRISDIARQRLSSIHRSFAPIESQSGSSSSMTDESKQGEAGSGPGTESALAPIWFIAHGGPPTVFDTTHPAHQHWLRLAKDTRSYTSSSSGQRPPLRGIVFVSAHWQTDPFDVAGSPMGVQINTDSSNPLLYDYYGFPPEFYSLKLRSENPSWLHTLVGETLTRGGVPTYGTQRGVDHGVFIPLLAGFGASGEGLPPLVQVSLPPPAKRGNEEEDGVRALRLGRALRPLREKGIAIVGGGQPVHALRDLFTLPKGTVPPYTKPFTKALTAAVCPAGAGGDGQGSSSSSNETSSRPQPNVNDPDPPRWDAAKALFRSPHYRGAHPTSEHLLPVLVALGAAWDHEEGVEEFKLDEGALAWNMYKWG